MGMSQLFSIGKNYLLLGISLVSMLSILTVIGYRLVYRLLLHGKKAFPLKQYIWFVLFFCYIVVVLGATLLERGEYYDNSTIQPLFYSYRLAWYGYACYEWRNIILNILLFVPLGFWLPFGIRKFRHFYVTYLTGFLFTCSIELTQLFLNKGIFELDDIMDNTIGAMIGYGFFALWAALRDLIHKRKVSLTGTLAFQLPLFLTILAFLSLYLCYQKKELGNLSIYPVSRANVAEVTLADHITVSEEVVDYMVYELPRLSIRETRELAENCFESLDTTISDTEGDIYAQTAVYKSTGDYEMWIDYIGGVYHIMDYSYLHPDHLTNPRENATLEELLDALSDYPVTIPRGVTLESTKGGSYLLRADKLLIDDIFYDGTFSLFFYDDGRFFDLNNRIYCGTAYKEFPCISSAQALDKLRRGEFSHFPQTEALTITVNRICINYMADTKGFYQPVYRFDCIVNGAATTIRIPALKKH